MKNLSGNEELANKTLRAFAEAALKVSPTATEQLLPAVPARLVGAGRKTFDQPRSLAAAFYEPISGTKTELNVAVSVPRCVKI